MKKLILTAAMLVGLGLVLSNQLLAGHSARGCHNCHVPHNAGDPTDPQAQRQVPLWSNVYQEAPMVAFTLYSSLTFDAGATITQPDGAAKLCLGCHDGSYVRTWNQDRLFEPHELINTHPVSFVYDTALATADGTLHDPSTTASGLGGTIAQDLLDINSKVQCISCHDVHATGFTSEMLRFEWDPAAGTDQILCRTCHNK